MESSRRILGVAALGTILALFWAAPAGLEAGEEEALLQALDKAAQSGKPFKEMTAEAKPAVQAAQKPGHDAALAKLKDEYSSAKSMLEEKTIASAALRISILAQAATELGNTALFGDCRLIPWQELFDLSESSALDRAQQVEAATKLAKLWQPLWDNLFDEVLRQHRAAETRGDAAGMKTCITQMELLAEAAQKAFSREDMALKAKSFKEALEKFKSLPPEQREVKQEADEALQRARHKFEAKEFQPAKDVLDNKAIPLFEKLKDKRGLAQCYLLHAEIREGEKAYGEILDWLEKAKTFAAESADMALINEIAEYEKKLREREKAGELELTKNPFVVEKNFGPEEVIKLSPQYGPVKDSRPLPQTFDNPYFWRPVDLEMNKMDEKGKPKNVVKLPFPEPDQFWLLWDGKELKLASDEKGTGGRPLKTSSTISKESLNINYWMADKNKNLPLRYEFLVLENTKSTIAGSFRDFGKSETYLGLRIHSNTYREGKLDGQRFLVCDDNTNGQFLDQGSLEVGSDASDHFFWGCDSVVIGTGKTATSLYGSLLRSKDKYYFLSEADKGGTFIKVKEFKGPRGKVSVKFNGPKTANILHFVIGTATGGGRLGFVNLGGEKGPVEVPTGAYFFKWGLLCMGNDPEKGDRVEVWKAKYPTFKVLEGKTTEIEFGGPYDVQMPVVVEGGIGELQSYNMKMYGAKGEEYRRCWPKPLLADFKIKDSAGLVVNSGKLRAFTEQDEMTPAGKGAGLLEFAKHVLFKLPAGQGKAPFKTELKTTHALLGAVETPGWK